VSLCSKESKHDRPDAFDGDGVDPGPWISASTTITIILATSMLSARHHHREPALYLRRGLKQAQKQPKHSGGLAELTACRFLGLTLQS
jgi:hypothetical protein